MILPRIFLTSLNVKDHYEWCEEWRNRYYPEKKYEGEGGQVNIPGLNNNMP